jgi:hypothetical protein
MLNLITNPKKCELNETIHLIIAECEKILGENSVEFYITSTIRPNAGWHTSGHAVDVASHNLPLQRKLFDALRENNWQGGLGLSRVIGNVHVHIDARTDGNRPRWIETDMRGNGPTEQYPAFRLEYARYVKEFG